MDLWRLPNADPLTASHFKDLTVHAFLHENMSPGVNGVYTGKTTELEAQTGKHDTAFAAEKANPGTGLQHYQ